MAKCECFDFPISWDFYRFHCWEIHGFDPGSNIAPETMPRIVEHIHRHSDMGKAEFDLLQQTVLKVDHLGKRIDQHITPKRKPQITPKTEGIGIKID